MASRNTGSPAFSFSSIDWLKIGKGALIAAAGAGLTYVTEWASGTDFGDYTPIVMAALSVAANIFRKYVFPQPA